ncbi:hypothetical protein [Corynebacterium tuberculostearicum]|uniref:hypothetical protein n=1 Tax=Corynebacterium TaxID=1716 RepID=UPI001EF2EDC6|nr:MULTISPECIES: hypothetical protein [Corynebacterium]MCG7460542.1 hypothetical protein [Corynebacterium sp. ACRPF]MDV2416788.1 hypothetical protein [Corynebacterium tuberculostearicum]
MKINVANVGRNINQIERMNHNIAGNNMAAVSPLTGSFSPVTGIDHVGAIHERVLSSDPGSARNSISSFVKQLEWLSDSLGREARGFQAQEDANSRGMEIADAGGDIGIESMPIMNQPEPGYSPFGFSMPVVNVGTDIVKLATDLMSTQIWNVSEANARWTSLASEVDDIVSGLQEAAGSLEGENDSEATSRAAAKIREVAASGSHFVANAKVMGEKLTGFHAKLMGMQPTAMAMAMEVMAIPEPVEREIAEKAALAALQPDLQRFAVEAMPYQHALMEQSPASGGGGVDAGLAGVDGDGQRYTTDAVVWPKKIAEAIARGDLGPGNFDVVNGNVDGLEAVGMSPQEINDFHQQMHNSGRNSLEKLGLGDHVAIGGNEVFTQGASMPGVTAPNGAMGQVPSGTSHPVAAGANTGALNNSGAMAPTATAQSANTGMAPMMAAGRPADAGRGVLGGQSLRGGIGSAAGNVSGSADIARAGRGAQSGQHFGRGAGAPYAGVSSSMRADHSNALGGGSGMRAGLGSGAGAGMRPGVGGGLVPGTGSSESAAAARGGNAGRSTGGARAYGPMMGMRGGKDSEKKRVKSVTTQVERDPNKRDLLGEPPAVVPGVIGDWVREVDPEK